jgi:hypothetical protein
MKKNKLLFIFLFFVLNVSAQNRFKPGLKLGLSTSQVAGDTYAGFNKAGLDGGATLTGKLNEKLSAQFEILFVQKGSKHVGDYTKGDYSFYLMRLNYIEVPVLLEYHQKKFTFEVGPGFGYLINSKEEDNTGVLLNTIPFYKTEVSGSIGLSYSIYKNWNVSWRFTNSLSPIRRFASGASYWFNTGQKNNVLAFTLTYTFENSAATE